MDRDRMFALLSSYPGAEETYPFGDAPAVFKVGGKMFALLSLGDAPARVSLKCDPDWAEELRSVFAAVTPGYHLSKRHWNTVVLDGSVPAPEIEDMADHSYDLVVAGLPRRVRDALPVD